MEFPSLINWASQFPFEGLLDDSFHFYSNCDRTFCKQTVETLIRRRIVASGLGIHCLHMSHKKDARLNLVNV